MLIWYSIAAYELLERKLTEEEKEGLFDVFYRMGKRMQLKGLPVNYNNWLIMHDQHLQANLAKSKLTINLFKQYKKHLGGFRYNAFDTVSKNGVPPIVKNY